MQRPEPARGVVAARLDWAKLNPGGGNVNALTSERLTDIGAELRSIPRWCEVAFSPERRFDQQRDLAANAIAGGEFARTSATVPRKNSS
jgi:hypothetical protein